MRLGIDLGTTRTVVACADRGNYPVVSFDDHHGDAIEHFPSVVAAVDGALVFGFDALAAAEDGAPIVRSFKRWLASPTVTGATLVRVGAVETSVLDVMTGFLVALREALVTRSNLPARKRKEPLSAVVAVPAHAHAAQRFLTLEAFRRAELEAIALLNEPSAAGFEYTHRLARTVTTRRTRVVVYDLGGGTFDASLVRVDGDHHDVIATAGHPTLGGDDFDEVLARCALAAAGVAETSLDEETRQALLAACREAKETLGPNKRRIVLDAPFSAVVPVDDFYAAAAPLVERSLDVMLPLLGRLADDEGEGELSEVAGVYLVGGGSGLPLVPRLLKERFGRRVHRSPYPSASTAIGLAIAADESAGFSLTDRFSRSFGVFRERDGGDRLSFDALVSPDVVLPEKESAVVVRRRYRAAHNVGHYRFVECPAVDELGEPAGDLLPFGDVRFPFDARLRTVDDLSGVVIERTDAGHIIEERYVLDASGIVQVEIADLDDDFVRTFRLGAS